MKQIKNKWLLFSRFLNCMRFGPWKIFVNGIFILEYLAFESLPFNNSHVSQHANDCRIKDVERIERAIITDLQPQPNLSSKHEDTNWPTGRRPHTILTVWRQRPEEGHCARIIQLDNNYQHMQKEERYFKRVEEQGRNFFRDWNWYHGTLSCRANLRFYKN